MHLLHLFFQCFSVVSLIGVDVAKEDKEPAEQDPVEDENDNSPLLR